MDYGKITSTAGIQRMPNPYHLTVANPTEAQKATIASFDGWLEMVYTAQPSYDPETQYLTESWVLENGKAKQVWTINEKPDEPTLEERVDNLEDGMDALVGEEDE